MKSNAFEKLKELDREAAFLLEEARHKANDLLRHCEEQRAKVLKEAEEEVSAILEKERKKKEEEIQRLKSEFALKLKEIRKRIEEIDADNIVNACLNRIKEKICS